MKNIIPIIKKDGSIEEVTFEGDEACVKRVRDLMRKGNDVEWARAFEQLAHRRIKLLERQIVALGAIPEKGPIL